MGTLLAGKTAVIYGGGGDIGGAVARAFAREGAAVALVGRTGGPLDAVAEAIRAGGGAAETARLDALDERAVEEHAHGLAERRGGLDISVNLVSRGDIQGIPLLNMSAADITRPVVTGLTAAVVTARAAARLMAARGSGVILSLTSGSSRATTPMMGGTGPADAAVEAFLRYLAAEVGPSGVRVVGMHAAGVAGALSREKLAAASAGAEGPDPADVARMISARAMLRRAPRLEDVAETAVFLASERAGAITGTIVNVTCGLVPG